MNDQLIGAGIAILATLFGATLQYIFQFFTDKRARNRELEDRQLLRNREIFDKRATIAENYINYEYDSIINLLQVVDNVKSSKLKESIAIIEEANAIQHSSNNIFDAILVIEDDKLYNMAQEFRKINEEVRDNLLDIEAIKKKTDLEEYLSNKNISIMANKAAMIKRLDLLRAKY